MFFITVYFSQHSIYLEGMHQCMYHEITNQYMTDDELTFGVKTMCVRACVCVCVCVCMYVCMYVLCCVVLWHVRASECVSLTFGIRWYSSFGPSPEEL